MEIAIRAAKPRFSELVAATQRDGINFERLARHGDSWGSWTTRPTSGGK